MNTIQEQERFDWTTWVKSTEEWKWEICTTMSYLRHLLKNLMALTPLMYECAMSEHFFVYCSRKNRIILTYLYCLTNFIIFLLEIIQPVTLVSVLLYGCGKTSLYRTIAQDM